MKDFIKEVVLEHLHNEWGFDVNELATELYNHEFNYNNADRTSGMHVLSWDEVHDEITRWIR